MTKHRAALTRQNLFLAQTKLKGQAVTIYSEYYAKSVCTVESLPGGLVIQFAGLLANPPNKSNDHAIAYGSTKTGKRCIRIKRGVKTEAKMAAMRDLYIAALIDKGIMPPAFDCPVHVWIYLSQAASRQDSHNTPKAIGDWLEMVGIVENDKHAQIWPFRVRDYPQLQNDLSVLRIEVQPQEQLTGVLERVILESRKTLHGDGNAVLE